MIRVPFNDLNRQHESIMPELRAAFERVMTKNSYILGEEVKAFEAAFAQYTQTKEVIGCANGTDAIELILLALGIGAGDEVITVSHTFFATVEAICSVGATPVLIDVRADTGLMDPKLIEAAITPRTKAVMPVHLYGQPVDLEPIITICEKHNLFCIEDAAQAHGAKYQGKPAGCFGTAASFSFYPGKNLGALGDAGAVITNNRVLAERLRSLRDHGRSEKYAHKDFGWNMRMDGLQGAFLTVKLKHLDRWNSDRAKVAEIYNKELAGINGLTLMGKTPGAEHAYHLYVVCHKDREWLGKQLKEQGIDTGVHYPIGCHRQEAWTKKFKPLSLPVTEQIADTCLSLPIFGEMTEEEAMAVVAAVKKVLL